MHAERAFSIIARVQLRLFDRDPLGVSDPRFASARRLELGEGSWIDHAPEWLAGHRVLYEMLLAEARFSAHRRTMYYRVVDVPRLLANAPRAGAAASVLRRVRACLEARYGLALPSVTLAFYRDGRDSVAMHGDKMGSLTGDTVVAVLSLGHPRRFSIKPLRGGPSRQFSLGLGDLLVMGGACQRTHLHGVPKAASAEGRISVMFRPEVPETDPRAEARARRARIEP